MKYTKRGLIISQITFIGFLLVFAGGCKKAVEIPKVSTTSISDTTFTTALSGGIITSDGGGEITTKGVCWSENQDPTIADSTTVDGSGNGNFSSKITGLSISTTYYVRAYATNKAGTGYGNTVSLQTKGTVADIDGNIYHVVQIGSQIWMKENLKVTHFNDGTPIPLVEDGLTWANLSTPGYCWYNNDSVDNKNIHGAMYNSYAVKTGKLCPSGWHVPTNQEWTTLTDFLGGLAVAGGKLKEAGTSNWSSPNTGATNESNLSLVPGGYRAYHNGAYFALHDDCTLWSSTDSSSFFTWCRVALNNTDSVKVITNEKTYGVSVRCIKN